MLHTVSRIDARIPAGVLRGMFEARRRVFVDLLGWSVPVIDNLFEIDQFDDEHAAYLIITDAFGAHCASARILPTTRSHILGDLYARLCEGNVPTGCDVREVTRFCLEPRLPAAARRRARDQLVHAIAEHALKQSVKLLTGVAEMTWLQQILAFGWRCWPLGLPQAIDGKMLGALAIEVTGETSALLTAAGIQAGACQDATEVRHAA